MYTEQGRPGEIARALRAGIEGVFEFPGEIDELCESARRIAPRISNTLTDAVVQQQFIGSGRAVGRVRDQILALSPLRVPVLLRGEPGSGRRHVASLLCGPLQSPVEVTAADAPTRVLREPCTYLLREVDEFTPQAQGFWAHALRAETASAGVRVLASTTQDLEQLVEGGLFDRSLQSALGRFELRLPPLRERREDIPALAEKLRTAAARSLGRPQARLTRGALAALQREPWPENLRGLQRVVEKAIAFASGPVIGVGEIRTLLAEGSESVDGLRSAREREAKDALIRELRQAGVNLAEVGRQLGISRGAVIYRAQKYGLLPEPRRKGERQPRQGLGHAARDTQG
jgi:DNA-binding NtrC family response regulator